MLAGALALGASALAAGAPVVTAVSGSVANGATVTIAGSGFGANGPNIVVFDDFEGGTAGQPVRTGDGSAALGAWTRITPNNNPVYSTSFAVSGQQAMRGDYRIKTNTGTDSSSSAFVDGIDTTDVFLSYWFYLPTTSSFPCYNGGICNWKLAWVWGQDSRDDDQVLPVILGSSVPNATMNSWYMSCNGCANNSPEFHPAAVKGKWYRVWAWVHATLDNTSRRDFWLLSPDEAPPRQVTKYVDNLTTQILESADNFDPPKMFQTFVFNAWARWCNDCAESYGFFDDVYLATGPNAQARIEIGNRPTYAASTNLAVSTVTAWSDGSITATVRLGSLDTSGCLYLYVIDTGGAVNSAGYPLASTCAGGDALAPAAPTNLTVQ
jgi:hypothetical protein